MKLRVTHTGVRVTAVAGGLPPTTLPAGDDGTTVRYCRVAVEPLTAIPSFAFVRFIGLQSQNGTVAANTDMMISMHHPEVVSTRGFYSLNAISGVGLTVYVNVTPLDGVEH